MSAAAGPDPVRERRARIARLVGIGQRIGYGLFALAIAGFVAGYVSGFDDAWAALVVGCLVAGSIVLAPTIVLGYAVRAAEREDVERGL